MNGDPFVGFFETPVTSAPIVAWYLSNLPAYRTGVSPLLRGVEVGLAHGFLLTGPFIKVRSGAIAMRRGQTQAFWDSWLRCSLGFNAIAASTQIDLQSPLRI